MSGDRGQGTHLLRRYVPNVFRESLIRPKRATSAATQKSLQYLLTFVSKLRDFHPDKCFYINTTLRNDYNSFFRKWFNLLLKRHLFTRREVEEPSGFNTMDDFVYNLPHCLLTVRAYAYGLKTATVILMR